MDFFTNILSGGILGVVTSLTNVWFKYKADKEEHAFQLAKIKAQSDASIEEIKANIQVQQIVTEGSIKLEENKADTAESVGRNSLIAKLTSNYISDSILKLMLNDNSLSGRIFRPLIYLHLLFMDAVRGLIRPVLTVGIVWYITYIINMSLSKYMGATFSQTDLMDLVIRPAIELILFSASTVIAFWFSDKATSRRFQQGISK